MTGDDFTLPDGTPLFHRLDETDPSWRRRARLLFDGVEAPAGPDGLDGPDGLRRIDLMAAAARPGMAGRLMALDDAATLFHRQWHDGEAPVSGVRLMARAGVDVILQVRPDAGGIASDDSHGTGAPMAGGWDLTDLLMRREGAGADSPVPAAVLRSWTGIVDAQARALQTLRPARTDCMPHGRLAAVLPEGTVAVDDLRRAVKAAGLPEAEALIGLWAASRNGRLQPGDAAGVPLGDLDRWVWARSGVDEADADCRIVPGTDEDRRASLRARSLPDGDGLWYGQDGQAWIVDGDIMQEVPDSPWQHARRRPVESAESAQDGPYLPGGVRPRT